MYPIAPPDDSQDTWDGFAADYTRAASGGVESFVARSGQVEITRVSPQRVEGTFRFAGVRNCARPAPGSDARPSGPCDPAAVDLAAPTIEVSGLVFGRSTQHRGNARRGTIMVRRVCYIKTAALRARLQPVQ
ncbi:hypothetical protein BH24GEM2_BH24GEM2_04570 [soil metagenome]